MGFLDGIARAFGYQPVDYFALQRAAGGAAVKTQPVTDAPAFLRASAAEDAFSVPDRTLPIAQLELYQRLTWVQIAVSAVAGAATTTAFNVMQLAGEESKGIPNHPFELLLRHPNPLQSRAELLEATLSHYSITGNAFWWLNKTHAAAPPDEIWCLPANRVRPVPDGRMYLRGYIYETDWGEQWPLDIAEVVHFKRFHPLNQFVGLSPLESLSVVTAGDLAMQQWNTNFFAKSNAKIPGILAFSDPIQDAEWDKMKTDIRARYGGTNRELMMLRNAGKGGVQYIATALSQGDMQFLEGRTFTKEEIFAIYAPGLSSVLSVNATEANSVSGKRTFIEYGVWPHLVRLAEKISSDILPLYGPGLTGEFTDIRVTDKQLELSEIAAYGQTHTVDEVRAKYYQSKPLGDDRGNLLVAEVGKGLTAADPNPPPPVAPPNMPEQAAPQSDEQPAADKPAAAGDTDDTDDAGDAGDADRGRQTEIKALKRWLRNRKNPDPLKFKRVHLSEDDVLQVAGWEAATAHDFFTQGSTREHWTALKALVLQLDPDEDDAEERIYRELERRGETALLRAFREQWRNLLPPNAEDMELDELMEYVNARLLQTPVIPDAVSRIVQNGADAGVNVALDQLGRIGVSFDYTLVNTRAREWAAQYGGELVRNIDDTTQQAVRQSVQRWYTNGEPLSALTADLEPTFGEKRARLIASTETTRASAQGTYTGLKESGVVTGVIFKTSNDEKVCPWCGSLDGKIISIDGGAFYDELSPELQSRLKRRFDLPPVHPNCRCRISGLVKEI